MICNINLYAYCEGNPVGFVDPSGYAHTSIETKQAREWAAQNFNPRDYAIANGVVAASAFLIVEGVPAAIAGAPKAVQLLRVASPSANKVKIVESAAKGRLIGNLNGLTNAEKGVVNELVGSGKTVEIIQRSNVNGVKTPDFRINGVLTELKTLTGTSLNTPITRIQDAFKQGAESVIIDARGNGITLEQAQSLLNSVTKIYKGNLPGSVQIWTNNGIVGGP